MATKKKYTLPDVSKMKQSLEWGTNTADQIDANNDGKKDNTDVETMMKIAAGWDIDSAMDPYKGKEIKPGEYGDTQAYMLGKMVNRQPFSFSGGGELYDAYAKAYKREGDLAAKDTLSKASAMTGGVPSSYAVTATAAQQNQYAAELADKIPELYQMELNKYYNDAELDRADLNTLMGVKAQDTSDAYNAGNIGDYSLLEKMGIDTTKLKEGDALELALTKFEVFGDATDLIEMGFDPTYLYETRDRDTADWKAGYGDYSGAKDAGVDTSWIEGQQAKTDRATDTEYNITMYELTKDPKYLYAIDPNVDISQILKDQEYSDTAAETEYNVMMYELTKDPKYLYAIDPNVDISRILKEQEYSDTATEISNAYSQAQLDNILNSGSSSGGSTSKEYSSTETSAISTKLQMGANYWDDDVKDFARNVYGLEPAELYYYMSAYDADGLATGVTLYDVVREALDDTGRSNVTVIPISQWKDDYGSNYTEYLRGIIKTYL